MKDLIKLGFGKKEASKTGKGAVVGGAGALVYSIISGMGYMPDILSAPDVVPYVVAGLSAAINFVRQFIVDND
jgi:hypothetical protein|tara:strand:- start:408 stop:626 length:219 start_codon:yes stop_codon:yes gene_type:complete